MVRLTGLPMRVSLTAPAGAEPGFQYDGIALSDGLGRIAYKSTYSFTGIASNRSWSSETSRTVACCAGNDGTQEPGAGRVAQGVRPTTQRIDETVSRRTKGFLRVDSVVEHIVSDVDRNRVGIRANGRDRTRHWVPAGFWSGPWQVRLGSVHASIPRDRACARPLRATPVFRRSRHRFFRETEPRGGVDQRRLLRAKCTSARVHRRRHNGMGNR